MSYRQQGRERSGLPLSTDPAALMGMGVSICGVMRAEAGVLSSKPAAQGMERRSDVPFIDRAWWVRRGEGRDASPEKQA